MNIKIISSITLLIMIFSGCTSKMEKQFADPPAEYKPMPFWRIGGGLPAGQVREEMEAAKRGNFGGVTAYAQSDRPVDTSKGETEYLSEGYFDRFRVILETARELGLKVIIYDDDNYPSGMAGGKMEELYPEHTKKRLDKIETEFEGPGFIKTPVPQGVMMSAVAMNEKTLERVNLGEYINNGELEWHAPEGQWKVMFFNLLTDGHHHRTLLVDFMDTTALRLWMGLTYDEYYKRFSEYYGNVIQQTFFDDVGFFRHERAWTGRFNDIFKELNGFDPRPYYPALWYNIGPDTEAIRHAFFLTRAELLAEGFPKMVGEWTEKHGIESSGHPPGNYDPQPVDMHGDIFRFFRHTQIPTADILFYYGYGQHGFRLISSAADYYDRPKVAAEIYCALRPMDRKMLYRPMMDGLVHGINFFIPCRMCQECSEQVFTQLSDGDDLLLTIQNHNQFAGRACMMLQGGRRVAEIGLIYPFESLAGWFHFDAPIKYTELKGRHGKYIAPHTDYLDISGLLTTQVRRDFTFVHPEFFTGEKYEIRHGRVKLKNKENFQEYYTMILPGCNVVSYKVLERLKDFYDGGGKVISTTKLPYKSSELGQDQKVIDLVKELFGVDPKTANHRGESITNSNENGGQSIFIPHPDQDNMASFLDQYVPSADVRFNPAPELKSGIGHFTYVHKIKDGVDIYYFANSSDDKIETEVLLRGNLKVETWDPHHGTIEKLVDATFTKEYDSKYTKVKLTLEPVTSLFLVGK